MKWPMTQKWLVLCLGFFLVIAQPSLVWAQPEPEEEEEALPEDDDDDPDVEDTEETDDGRPNPMDKTTLKGLKSSSLPENQMKTGKGITAGGVGVARPGSSSASASGQVPTPDNPIDPVTVNPIHAPNVGGKK